LDDDAATRKVEMAKYAARKGAAVEAEKKRLKKMEYSKSAAMGGQDTSWGKNDDDDTAEEYNIDQLRDVQMDMASSMRSLKKALPVETDDTKAARLIDEAQKAKVKGVSSSMTSDQGDGTADVEKTVADVDRGMTDTIAALNMPNPVE